MAALDEMEVAFDKLASLSFDDLAPREILAVLARREVMVRRQPVVEHKLINKLIAESSPIELGATTWPKVLSHKLNISQCAATRRIEEAADLGPRRTLTGLPLEPKMPHLAAAQAEGLVGAEHVAITREFFAKLPGHVDRVTREQAERTLASAASQCGPQEYGRSVRRLAALLDQDGEFSDRDRARRRGIMLGKQGSDGLTPISGTLTPECRAAMEAILAKLAAPGMCNPEDPHPCVDGKPSQEQIQGDVRTAGQRNHDAFLAAGRVVLSSRQLGRLNGLPVTVIVSTTLAELESAAGHAVTAGGSLLPIRDLIRMASHAHHYLAIFDGHGIPLHLGHSRRTASIGQRIVLHALDRGCTAPGCTASAYHCQAHHVIDWSAGGPTDVTNLALACGGDNRKVGPGGYRTRRRAKDNRVEWIPPPHLDDGRPRVNGYHHPEDILLPDPHDDG